MMSTLSEWLSSYLSHRSDRSLLLFVVNGLHFGLGEWLTGFWDDFNEVQDEDSASAGAFLAEAIGRSNDDVTLESAHSS